jgi:uncharacterized protein (DUF885 family)
MESALSELRPDLDAFLDDLFRHQPVFATGMGDHRFDARWPDVSPAGLEAFAASMRTWRSRFAGLDDGGLSSDDAIDRDVLVEVIDRFLFEVEELGDQSWDALGYVYLAGGGLFALLARDFAPLAERMTSIAGRVEGVPALLDASAANLTGLPDRPVSLLHLETALSQVDGITQLIEQAIAEARAALDERPDDALDSALRRTEAGLPAAREAVERFRRHLEDEVRPRAEGDGRLGPELYARKLRWTLGSDLAPQDLLARAERDRVRVTAEMLRLARELWPSRLSGTPMPTTESEGSQAAADRATIRRALDAIAGEHPAMTEMLDRFRAENVALEAFITERRLLEVPNEPLEIIWTPLFLRSFGGAYLDAPGPLERGQKSFFGFTPPPDDATPEQVESLLREQNDRMVKVLCIHEAIPGHYLQLWYSNRYGTLARSVFSSSIFAEGWAVYVTQVLMDLGFADGDPALLLTHWKFYLRAIINAILDVRIHGGVGEPVDEAEAMRLMTEDGFQEQQEARAKWNRARLTATQLSTYYVGSTEMWDVEIEARRRAAAAAGKDGAVPESRVVGGFGETPGFSYPDHLRAVLSHGTPPVHFLRRILFDGSAVPAATAPRSATP